MKIKAIMIKILFCTISTVFFGSMISAQNLTINIQEFGAIGDGKVINTDIIQSAIDKVHSEGGGVVFFPTGNWMTGKIFLKSNVTIDISPEATLLAAPGPIYAEPKGSIESLIYGDQLENITIKGGGVIEGKTGITRERGEGFGRRLVGLERCKKVTISNITITHGGGITVLLHSLDSLEMDHVKVLSFFSKDPEGGEGKDALDLDGCRNVWIHDCEFRGSDDAFAFKARGSIGFQTTSENIIIERCRFASRTCNAIQFGSETNADFRNIRISDCTIEYAGKAGIGITMNDGHIIEDVVYNNITMRNICTPIYIGMTARNGIGVIRNVKFDNIKCSEIIVNPEYGKPRSPHGYWVSTINGLEEMKVEDIIFENVSLNYKGGVDSIVENIQPPDPPKDYQPRKLGIRPASGFYIRHASNIEFNNLTITYQIPDIRSPIFLDDVENILLDNCIIPLSKNNCQIEIQNSPNIESNFYDLRICKKINSN